jgi:predicted transglutaminase-like cysteine proteinase
MTFNTPALAPSGFIRFCIRYPQVCAPTTESVEPQLVPLTEVGQAELAMVNDDINQSITPSEKITSSPDEWSVSPREGRCTDYAMTKRHYLLALGWPEALYCWSKLSFPRATSPCLGGPHSRE